MTGYFPCKWKTATIVPIPKVSNTNIAAEFRGINMLPIDKKIIENFVNKQLMNYIESNDFISRYQSAFRAKTFMGVYYKLYHK